MTSKDFTLWLQGYLDGGGGVDADKVREKLAQVFDAPNVQVAPMPIFPHTLPNIGPNPPWLSPVIGTVSTVAAQSWN